MLIDTHAHLNFEGLSEEIDDIIARADEDGVTTIINIGTSLEESREVIDLARKYENFYATVGLHPTDAKDTTTGWEEKFRKMAGEDKVVGIGECGLDIYTSDNSKGGVTSDKEVKAQATLFENQLQIAQDFNKPVIIHCRGGWNIIFDILKNFKVGGVFHSWTGNVYDLEKAMAAGFLVSFSGIVTFKNAQDAQECAKLVPKDKFILETDSPFLSPEPKRGRRNEPSSVKIIAEFIAKLRKSSLETIANQSTTNAKRVFNI